MDIGKLNRQIDLLKFVTQRDEFGGEVGEWTPIARIWARIEPVSGTEYFQAQQVQAETVTRITVRYNPEITVMHRIRYGTKLYEIIGVSDDQTGHRATVINCKEVVNDELQRKAAESKDDH